MLQRFSIANFVLLNFNLFNLQQPTDYADLYNDITGAGYIVFNMVMRIGIWSILLGIVFLAWRIMLNSGQIKMREENKKIATKYIIVTLLLLNIVGIASIVFSAGLDM